MIRDRNEYVSKSEHKKLRSPPKPVIRFFTTDLGTLDNRQIPTVFKFVKE